MCKFTSVYVEIEPMIFTSFEQYANIFFLENIRNKKVRKQKVKSKLESEINQR